MDGLRDELFAREEEEAMIVDDGHVVTDGENSQIDSQAKRAWVDSEAKCNPVDSIGSSTESRVSHSEPRLLLGFQKGQRRLGEKEH
jgi:hypothetical protein